MEHLRAYVAAMNLVIQAGVDVRYLLNGHSVPVIRMTILEEAKLLQIHYLTSASPLDQTAVIPASSNFSIELNDYPNELREAGWK
ncbi:MAG TPA: hypothetical protein VFV38_50230 [Ktedonobacteraceae bacterium]|nr:hypothetical protein [Ktedonobacteraceae bacterium]